MDAEEAAEDAIATGVKSVVPMHNHSKPMGDVNTRLEKNPEIKVGVELRLDKTIRDKR